MLRILLAAGALLCYCLWFAGPARKLPWGVPVSLFLAVQAPFLATVIWGFDEGVSVHREYAYFCFLSLPAITIGAVAGSHLFGSPVAPIAALRLPSPRRQMAALRMLALISSIVGAYFVSRVGHNVFIETMFGDGSQNFRDLRSAATRSQYVAAGYSAQFVAIILPTLAIGLVLEARVSGSRKIRAFGLALLLLSSFFVTATGGRRYIVEIIVLLGLVSIPRFAFAPSLASWRNRPRVFYGILLILFAFISLTALQGRLDTSGSGLPLTMVQTTWNRLGGDYALNELRAIEYLATDDAAWGEQWLENLEIVLPGPTKGQTLDSRLHEFLYGSADANSPLSIWGSVYYNWGIVWGLMWMVCFGAVSMWLVAYSLRRSTSPLTLAVTQALAFRLIFMRDPYSFLLEGILTLLVLLIGLRAAGPSDGLGPIRTARILKQVGINPVPAHLGRLIFPSKARLWALLFGTDILPASPDRQPRDVSS